MGSFISRQITEIQLANLRYQDISYYIPEIKEGKVISVYDGDTFTLAAKLPYYGSPIYKFRVRIAGIDAPEMKGATRTEKEKMLATEAQEHLSKLIHKKWVKLHNVKLDKYGRILADVFVASRGKREALNVAQDMLQHKLAVAYDGGTKHTPAEWLA
jgi:endonuclease YncB( thermonuclease family)